MYRKYKADPAAPDNGIDKFAGSVNEDGEHVPQVSMGAGDEEKITDPDAADATVIGLLRGILEKLAEIATNTET